VVYTFSFDPRSPSAEGETTIDAKIDRVFIAKWPDDSNARPRLAERARRGPVQAPIEDRSLSAGAGKWAKKERPQRRGPWFRGAARVWYRCRPWGGCHPWHCLHPWLRCHSGSADSLRTFGSHLVLRLEAV